MLDDEVRGGFHSVDIILHKANKQHRFHKAIPVSNKFLNLVVQRA